MSEKKQKSVMGGTVYASQRHNTTAIAKAIKVFPGREAYKTTQGVRMHKRGSIEDKFYA